MEHVKPCRCRQNGSIYDFISTILYAAKGQRYVTDHDKEDTMVKTLIQISPWIEDVS